MTYKKSLKKIQKGAEELAEETTRGIRKKLVGAAGQIEEDVSERKGVIGGIAEAVDSTMKAGRHAHQEIQKEGGYLKKGKDIVRKGMDAVEYAESALERTADKLTGTYKDTRDSLGNRFYTDGHFDTGKVRTYLAEQANAAQHQGERALQAAGGLISKLEAAYRKEMPSPTEKRDVYGHIGTEVKHRGALSRKDYEACEAFYATARSRLPGGLRLRPAILKDIQDSASGNLAQLVQYYSKQTDDTGNITTDAKARLEIIGRKNYKL